jgi:protein involved in polysaccharide export with SLBB domain
MLYFTREFIAMKTKTILFNLFLLTLAAFILTGCSYPNDIAAFVKASRIGEAGVDYVLQSPDEIEIHSSKVPEVHMQRQQIRPDGKITFEGIGAIQVGGKTTGEVNEIIKEKVLRLYSLVGNHPVYVRITAFKSKYFYVFGEVRRPGAHLYTGDNTVMTAMAEALPTTLAWEEVTKIIRPSGIDGVRAKTFKLNYYDMIKRGDMTKNVRLEEGDVIYVPPTILASIAKVIEEFVRPIGSAFSTVNIVQRAGVGGGGGGRGGY